MSRPSRRLVRNTASHRPVHVLADPIIELALLSGLEDLFQVVACSRLRIGNYFLVR